MAETVNLVLYPQVKAGEVVEDVKEKLQKTLNVDAATVDSWYATEQPTAILKDVEESIAGKYLEAIQKCGAEANLQPSGQDKSSWSLEQMTKAEFKDLFICPSCEYDEEVERDQKIEQCPKCGLVIAKWEEKMREEAEKEKIRKRLLRDQRLKGDREDDLDAKRKELERLRDLEREIMKELGIKPPSALWMFFEKYTISMSFAISIMIVALTGVAFRYVDMYIDQLAYEETVAETPSEEIQGIAPVVAAAVELQQQGNQQVVTEIADATQMLRGAGGESRQELMQAAQQMMKGVDPQNFIAAASKMAPPMAMAKLSAGEVAPAPVNLDTIGGVSGLQGVTNFTPGELKEMSPPLLEHGHEQILNVLTEKQYIKDVLNPEAPEIIVERIDEMDGSAIVILMSSIGRDQEWDQFLLSQVNQYIVNGDIEAAEKLGDRIRNPVVRINAFGRMMEEYLLEENASQVKVLSARVKLDLDKIQDHDTRARVILNHGQRLAAAGDPLEPAESMNQVARMASDTENAYEQAFLNSRLAVAYMNSGDQAQAKRLLQEAQRTAGRIPALDQRITAFTKLAQRYYDVRNNTLASEILAEAAVLAATRLEQQPRSVAFGEIALAQAYAGDFVGARQSIDNASEGKGKQQLIAKIAEMLMGEERFYEALSWMESLQDEVEYCRLELRLSSTLFYAGRTREALNQMEQSAPRMLRIYELSERGLLTSQYARFFARLGKKERSEELFGQARDISKELKGRKSQVNLALVALDRARVFQLAKAKEIVREELTDSVVRDPIDTEVIATERIINNLLPKELVK